MYQALYRKYRPQTFEDVIGQEHITGALKNQVASGRLSHAYIFIGTRGTGKTTCARILAKAVNCENPQNGNPCGCCPTCKAISAGEIMDIVELDAASNNGVDNVRALRDEAVFSPAEVKKRVYIIDEVHMLSTAAFNALLKILEEPPEHLMFILATTELQKVPATILSRCQRHSFKRIPAELLSSHLENIASKEGIKLSRDAAMLISALAEGSVRDSLSILEQCAGLGRKLDAEQVCAAVGLAGSRRTGELLRAVIDGDLPAVFASFNSLWMDGKDPVSLLKELSGMIRDVMIVKLAPEAASSLIYGGYDKELLSGLAGRASLAWLCSAQDTIQTCISKLTDPKMNAELCLARLAGGSKLQAPSYKLQGDEGYEKLQAPSCKLQGDGSNDKLQAPSCKRQGDEGYEKLQATSCKLQGDESNEKLQAASGEELQATSYKLQGDGSNEKLQAASCKLQGDERSGEAGAKKNEGWDEILKSLEGKIPKETYLTLNNPSLAQCRFSGDRLEIFAEPSMYLQRLSRPEIQEKIIEAVKTVSGKEISITVKEKTEESSSAPLRDIEELAKYPEVKFI